LDTGWILESIAANGRKESRPIDTLPFTVGRGADNHLAVNSPGLSRNHATLSIDSSGNLRLTDLGSTNGSFVNRERIQHSRPLEDQDVLHFGTAEFRLRRSEVAGNTTLADPLGAETQIMAPGRSLSEHFVPYERAFLEFLGGRGVSGAVQPIVHAGSGALFAYELLGRCAHPELKASAIDLFRMAATLDREVELSTTLRNHGVKAVAQWLPAATLFVNTHPLETFEDSFLRSLERLRKECPQIGIVIEVHETAVTESGRLRELAAHWRALGLRFAYDDFGAGQARLNEIGEVPADFVKFDMGLIHKLDEAGDRKQRVVRYLVKLVRDLGSVPLAEGVETQGEREICEAMGFELLQGYLTGRPAPIDTLGLIRSD
jgi:EAL domain-containing protein (putative c-di-GMP-specific phosphodiesterase class I)